MHNPPSGGPSRAVGGALLFAVPGFLNMLVPPCHDAAGEAEAGAVPPRAGWRPLGLWKCRALAGPLLLLLPIAARACRSSATVGRFCFCELMRERRARCSALAIRSGPEPQRDGEARGLVNLSLGLKS